MLEKTHPRRRILDMGCGNKKLAHKYRFPNYNFHSEVIGLDLNKTDQTDVVYDLNKGKLPFEDNYFDIVYTPTVWNILKILSRFF